MGSLFDELKKAKLIDKKKAKRLQHEKRTSGKRDRDRDADLKHKDKKHADRRDSAAGKEKKKGEKRRGESKRKERWAELKQLVKSRKLEERHGAMRWHFVTASGQAPFLPVSPGVGKRLEGGELGIVRDPNASWPRYVIVPRDVAQGLREFQAELVLFLVGS